MDAIIEIKDNPSKVLCKCGNKLEYVGTGDEKNCRAYWEYWCSICGTLLIMHITLKNKCKYTWRSPFFAKGFVGDKKEV